MEKIPEKSAMKNNAITMMNGLSVCFRFNSLSFSIIVGNGCEHVWFSLIHELQNL